MLLKMTDRLKSLFILFGALLFAGCTGIPPGIEPVQEFELERYLGKWYEIARLDHSFERGLINVTADYSMRADGGVDVINRGFDEARKSWREARGRAYFMSSPEIAHLKVSFFGPFYGSYIVFNLDRVQYQYVLVCGPDRSYLWILSRSPVLSPHVLEELVTKADTLGFETDKLIFVRHESGS